MGPHSVTRRRLVATTAAAATLGLVGCRATSVPTSGASGARTLRIGATAEPQSMDPTTQTGVAIQQALLYNVYETLVKVDGTGALKPLLAQTWQVSTDRCTYTFHLDPKAKFSSGAPVDAAAVVANINRIRTGKGIVPLFRRQMAVVAGATATDAQTVTVTLTRPSQAWLYAMGQGAGIIADPAAFTTLATKPVASGPFALGAWTKGQSVQLQRNHAYWGTPPRFDEVTFRYFADGNAMSSAMLSGDLDVISDLTTPEALASFSDTARYTVVEGTTNGEVTLGMNQGAGGNPALKDVRVRRAINHAIDRRALLDAVWGGKGTLIGSMVPPTDPWYEDLSKTYPYDPARAKALLAEAGVKNLTLRLRTPSLPYGPAAAQFITSQLKAVGITVAVEELDFPRWLKEVFGAGNYDLTIVNHVEPRDIVNFADPAYYWHYDNPAFTKLVTQADQADDAGYVSMMRQAAKMLATDAAADWLWLFPHIVVTRADITGVVANQVSPSFDLTTLASRNG